MIEELDLVVLTHDVGEHHLERGDVGAVVHRYEGVEAFEVELVTADGKTVALLTLSAADVRSMRVGEILHARELVGA